METLGNYAISHSYKISLEKQYQKEEMEHYFLISLPSETLPSTNILQLENYLNKQKESTIDKYKEMMILRAGGKIYMIGTDDIIFGFKEEKQSFWCKLKLC